MTLALLALLCACTVGRPSPTPHPTPSATTVADQQRCERLAKRGFTPCPPAADRMPLPPTTIRNATNGAVPDATAQQWGRAFQLAQAYYYWAMQHNARDALTSGALSDPTPNAVTNLFGDDLMDLDRAKQAGGVLVYEPPRTPVVQTVAIPADLQQAMRGQGLTPKPYGVAVQFMGPTRRAIRTPNGGEAELSRRDATFQVAVVYWGEVRSDSDLGGLWYESGNYGCDAAVRNVCQM